MYHIKTSRWTLVNVSERYRDSKWALPRPLMNWSTNKFRYENIDKSQIGGWNIYISIICVYTTISKYGPVTLYILLMAGKKSATLCSSWYKVQGDMIEKICTFHSRWHFSDYFNIYHSFHLDEIISGSWKSAELTSEEFWYKMIKLTL